MVVSSKNPPWRAFYENLEKEETYFQGDMRLYAVRVWNLLLSPD
jgi:hypothetical protein